MPEYLQTAIRHPSAIPVEKILHADDLPQRFISLAEFQRNTGQSRGVIERRGLRCFEWNGQRYVALVDLRRNRAGQV